MASTMTNGVSNGTGAEHSKTAQIQEIIDAFKFGEDRAQLVMDVLEREMTLGLSKNEETRKKSSLLMENTFVRETVDGTEHGDFLALDLGGTNFRILYMSIREGDVVHLQCEPYGLPEAILTGSAVALFDYLAEKIASFLQKHRLPSDPSAPTPLGFTFSFPMVQKKLNSGFLVTWTKGFKCQGGVMEDAVQLLEEAITRRGDVHIRVVAILNDATGTLMAGAYYDHQAEIGIILGTGSNCCYMEHLERIEKWEGETTGPQQVIIDIEWGAFGDNGVLSSIKTKYDLLVDLKSNHAGSFTFEKLFSGLYMGELVRLVLAELCTNKLIFEGGGSDKLFTYMSFETAYISKILSYPEGCWDGAQEVAQTLGLESVCTEDDLRVMHRVCAAVSDRAAHLVSACLAVLVKHVGKPEVAIAADGSVIKFHPTLQPMMEQDLARLCPDSKVRFVLADDGSGKGAAFVAAVAVKMEREGLSNSTNNHPHGPAELLSPAPVGEPGLTLLTESSQAKKPEVVVLHSPGVDRDDIIIPNGKHFIH